MRIKYLYSVDSSVNVKKNVNLIKYSIYNMYVLYILFILA